MSLFSYEQNLKTVNLNKVQYLVMTKISELLLEKGAMIFGGFVRDKYIHDHHATLYYNKYEGSDSQYDDKDHVPETKHRLLVPKDIDVFIRGTEEDVKEVYAFITASGFTVDINHRRKIYGAFDNIHQQKVVIKTMSNLGFPVIKIDLDVLYSSDEKVKPPFKRLDLWCNSLIMDKAGITFSNQTGSRVDNWNPFDRKIFEIGILSEILNLKTHAVELTDENTNEQSIKNKQMITRRIEVMQERGWIVKDTTY